MEGTCVAYDCRRIEKLICSMKWENVVAYGRLPSPALKNRKVGCSWSIETFEISLSFLNTFSW